MRIVQKSQCSRTFMGFGNPNREVQVSFFDALMILSSTPITPATPILSRLWSNSSAIVSSRLRYGEIWIYFSVSERMVPQPFRKRGEVCEHTWQALGPNIRFGISALRFSGVFFVMSLPTTRDAGLRYPESERSSLEERADQSKHFQRTTLWHLMKHLSDPFSDSPRRGTKEQTSSVAFDTALVRFLSF